MPETPIQINKAAVKLKSGQGSRIEWRILYDYFSPKMDHVARNFGLNKFEGDDVVQETFLRVYRNIHKWQKTDNFSAWFWKIAYGEFYRHLGKKKSVLSLNDLQEEGSQVNVENEVTSQLELERLKACIEKMPPRMRQTVLLFRFQDLPQKMVAKIMKVSLRAVQRQMEQAKKFLIKCFGKDNMKLSNQV